MKRLLVIIVLLLGIGITNSVHAQTGGRRKEHRNQRRGSGLFNKHKSKGNADKFAKGAGRKGIMARLFHKDGTRAWAMHQPKRQSGKTMQRDNKFLFSRYRTKGRKHNSSVQAKQNSDRAKRRVRGNAVFSKKKYS